MVCMDDGQELLAITAVLQKRSNELLPYFNEQNENCFDYSLAYKALTGSKVSAVRKLLSDMTKKGLFKLAVYDQTA